MKNVRTTEEMCVFFLSLQLLFETFCCCDKHLATYAEHICKSACRSSCEVVFEKKSATFWDVRLCSPLKISQCFRETCHLHLQGRIISQERNQHESRCQAQLRLDGLVFQKIVLSIGMTVRTLDPVQPVEPNES
jgi:hypothetical protein